MNIIETLNKVNAIGKYLLWTIIVVNLFSVGFASSALCNALSNLCQASQIFLGAAIMIMILLAGATYALGQVLGAETRARASVWATAMMTGALIGALIYLFTPFIIDLLLPEEARPEAWGEGITGGDPCGFQCETLET